MGIASENYGCVIFLRQTQQREVVWSRHLFVAYWCQRVVVDLKQRVRLLRHLHEAFKVEFGCAVPRMTYYLHEGVTHGLDHTFRVFFHRAALPAQAVYAGNAQVEHAPMFFVQTDVAVGVEYVQLSAKHQSYAVQLARHTVHVSEIYRVACSGNAWPMLCYAKNLQSLVGSGLCHLLKRTVCVT